MASKIQKQIQVIEYKGYQLRHSQETGRVTIYFGDRCVRSSATLKLAKEWVDKHIS